MPAALALLLASSAACFALHAHPRPMPPQQLRAATFVRSPRVACQETAAPNPKRGHDTFNLAVLPAAIGLCAAALAIPHSLSMQRKLGYFLTAYNLADMAWIAAQPSCVDAPAALLGHHGATQLCLLYCLTHPPHTRYIAWMRARRVKEDARRPTRSNRAARHPAAQR